MKKAFAVFALIAAMTSAEALQAQTEISARGANIRFGGRVQAQYQNSSVENSEADFFFRRVRLIADAEVTDFWSGRVQADLLGGEANLADAYVRMTFSDALQVSMGQFKRAFDLFELTSSADLSIIERDGRIAGLSDCTGVGRVCTYGRMISSLGYGGRDQGVRVEASGDRVAFRGTVTNGTGANNSDENDAKSFSGRLSFDATDMVTVSGQFGVHDYVEDGSDEYANAWGIDAQYGGMRDGLLVQASLIGGDNWKKLDDGGTASTFMAWQAAASLYMPLDGENIVGWEPLLRVSQGDPDTDMADDGGLVFTPGLMFFIQGRNKFGFNLDHYSPQSGDSEWSLKFQTFLYF